jgi:hypothetical protein
MTSMLRCRLGTTILEALATMIWSSLKESCIERHDTYWNTRKSYGHAALVLMRLCIAVTVPKLAQRRAKFPFIVFFHYVGVTAWTRSISNVFTQLDAQSLHSAGIVYVIFLYTPDSQSSTKSSLYISRRTGFCCTIATPERTSSHPIATF